MQCFICRKYPSEFLYEDNGPSENVLKGESKGAKIELCRYCIDDCDTLKEQSRVP